jgi:hypothetical protein
MLVFVIGNQCAVCELVFLCPLISPFNNVSGDRKKGIKKEGKNQNQTKGRERMET